MKRIKVILFFFSERYQVTVEEGMDIPEPDSKGKCHQDEVSFFQVHSMNVKKINVLF